MYYDEIAEKIFNIMIALVMIVSSFNAGFTAFEITSNGSNLNLVVNSETEIVQVPYV